MFRWSAGGSGRFVGSMPPRASGAASGFDRNKYQRVEDVARAQFIHWSRLHGRGEDCRRQSIDWHSGTHGDACHYVSSAIERSPAGVPKPIQRRSWVPAMINSIGVLRLLQMHCQPPVSIVDGEGLCSGCVCHSPR